MRPRPPFSHSSPLPIAIRAVLALTTPAVLATCPAMAAPDTDTGVLANSPVSTNDPSRADESTDPSVALLLDSSSESAPAPIDNRNNGSTALLDPSKSPVGPLIVGPSSEPLPSSDTASADSNLSRFHGKVPFDRILSDSESAPARSAASDTWREAARVVWGLGATIIAIFALRWLVRKVGSPLIGKRSPAGVVEVLAKYPFVSGQSLIMLKVDRRVLLVCQTKTGASTLTEWSAPADVASILHRVRDDRGETFDRQLELLIREDAAAANTGPNGRTSRTSRRVLSIAPAEEDDAAFDSADTLSGASAVIDLTRPSSPARRPWLALAGRSSGSGGRA